MALFSIEQVDLSKPESRQLLGAIKLDRLLFGHAHSCTLSTEIRRKYRPSLFVALASDGEVIGFKLGYERKYQNYYSWMGGVDPEHRAQGVGKALMKAQHAWAESQGYHAIRTQSKNKWRDMIILNLKSGFNIIGTFQDDEGDTKIMMEKRFRSVEED